MEYSRYGNESIKTEFMTPLSNISRKKIVATLSIILLITVLPITLILTKTRQDLRQRAAEITGASLTADIEYEIDGRVFEDSNNDRLFNEGDYALPNAKVYLYEKPNTSLNERLFVYTDEHGYYVLHDL